MIFSQIEFFIFFAVVLAGLWGARTNRAGKLWLLAASYYFYAYWDWRFLSLILLSTVVDYCVGLGLKDEQRARRRRALLIVSLCVNLGLLGFFKYFNFFIDSAKPIVEAVGLHAGSLDILLPVGISFYTFQTLSYTIDVYRRKMDAHEDFFDFALFVAFFPQLVAGPIVRAAHFLPQLAHRQPLTAANFYQGFQLFTYGLFKKVFVADRLAMFSDHVFANAGAYDSTTTWLGALAYSMQIYFDFSGYSDMAIGVACIMGYSLGENFNFPYLAKSPREFWHRWHISLSTWVRDYIYIPLGGSRGGGWRTFVNGMTAMILCGLWHGAAWTFVAWGALHGLALALNRVGAAFVGDRRVPGAGLLGWAATMFFVVQGWVLFRSESFEHAALMFRQMFAPVQGVAWYHPMVPFMLAGMAVVHAMKAAGGWERVLLPERARWFSPTILFSLLWLSVVFRPTGFNPFIYFQF
ncbi:MBOAT family O-acyltransferase [Pseudodesulfovibrio pelocollis]|uniref:MBOAT family O-acyltransferase n=1 Tax=Pseudodesulfovibrio pelocollis TaxID=3051432 RepID=UPI00255ABE98|nr:MBOAT family protein [Pseudodesulfovibrio sp. SB368]